LRNPRTLIAGFFLASGPCVGQGGPPPEQPSGPNAVQNQKSGGITDPAPDAPAADQADQEKKIEKQEQSYRVMGVVPLFGTTSRLDAPPLTPGGKFRLFARSSFDPGNFVLVGTQAGIVKPGIPSQVMARALSGMPNASGRHLPTMSTRISSATSSIRHC